MALFKISKGSKANLPTELTEGYCWYTYDDSKFYIDFKDASGTLLRQALNANEAEKLTGYDIATILSNSDVEIPTSQAIMSYLENTPPIAHAHTVSDISDLDVTADELNFVSGATSNIQSQLDFLTSRLFVGTYAQYQAANANGDIPINTLVILIDDESSGGGSSGDDQTSATTAMLGYAVLGQMVLG